MPEQITQIFTRPSDKVVDAIRLCVPSLNMYRFRAFDVGMVELSQMHDSVDEICLVMQFETATDQMLPGNRLMPWRWFAGLVRIGGDSMPAVPCYDMDYIISERDQPDEIEVQETDGSSRHSSAAERSLIYRLVEKGLENKEIASLTGATDSTIKRRRREFLKGKKRGRIRFARDAVVARPMKFDEHGDIDRPLTRSEHEQLVALLEAGVNYRDVAEMFDVNARELKFYGFENA